jgi:acyl-coenzyme A thioesterase PaaI-like protein
MKVSCMRSVRAVPLVGDGRVVHRGSSVVFMEGSLTAEDGSLVATATATGRMVRLAAAGDTRGADG